MIVFDGKENILTGWLAGLDAFQQNKTGDPNETVISIFLVLYSEEFVLRISGSRSMITSLTGLERKTSQSPLIAFL